jgi:ATP phosphoribosyltransferase
MWLSCCRWDLAGPISTMPYPRSPKWTPDQFAGTRIATSYPRLVVEDLKRRGVDAEIIRLDGAVEISVRLGVADAIADVVQTGRTLKAAGLKVVGLPLLHSEADPGRTKSRDIERQETGAYLSGPDPRYRRGAGIRDGGVRYP